MTEISSNRVIFLDDYISLSDIRVVEYYPVLSLIPKKSEDTARIFDALHNAHPNLTVYYKDQIPERYIVAQKNVQLVPHILFAVCITSITDV
jgi:ectonucleotide pyrophosphatase/phosphodiesterase family protein 5